MTTSQDLLYAILAMDSYNRGDDGTQIAPDSSSIANLEIINNSDDTEDTGLSFFASAYKDTKGTTDTSDDEIIISYRGTDSPLDMVTGWTTGAGAWASIQAIKGTSFLYNIIENDTENDPFNANVSFTGHSLGGGLAGLMGSVYGKEAIIFNNMPFGLSANGAFNAASDISIEGQANHDIALTYYYRNLDDETEFPPSLDDSGVSGFATSGEVLENIRVGDSYNTYFNPHANEGFVDLHSQALLVNLMFADMHPDFNEWTHIAPTFIDTLFDNEVGVASGSNNADAMLNKIAYSAIEDGPNSTTIFGDTAIRAMWNDANDLGGAIANAGENVSEVLQSKVDSISKAFVQYAGHLAQHQILQSAPSEVIDGIVDVSADSSYVTVNFEQSDWYDAGNALLFNIVGRNELFNEAFSSLTRGDFSIDATHNYIFATASGSTFTVTEAAPAGKANVIYGSEGVDDITGSSGDDYIFGEAGDDTLLGGGGNDVIKGGLGSGVLNGGEGTDTADFSYTGQNITVDLNNYSAVIDYAFEDEEYTLYNIENIIGGFGQDTITGTAGDNVLNGWYNNDSLIGGGGEDTYVFDLLQYLPFGQDTITDNDGDLLIDGVVVGQDANSTDGLATIMPNNNGNISGSYILSHTGITGKTNFNVHMEGDNLVMTHGTDRITINDFENGTFGISLNQAPIAYDDPDNAPYIRTDMGQTVSIDILRNDRDPEDGRIDPNPPQHISEGLNRPAQGSQEVVTITSNPEHGKIHYNKSDGSVDYTPNAGFKGADSFTYTVRDSDGAVSNEATVSVLVRGSGNSVSGTTNIHNIIGNSQNFWDGVADLGPTNYDPLVIDLDGDGIELIHPNDSNVFFNIGGNETEEKIGWVQPDDALLAMDINGNGQIDDISELFGNDTIIGFEELAVLDSNSDGLINASDTQFSNIQVWQDANSDGHTDAGELNSLSYYGITEIDLAYDEVSQINNGNLITEISAAMMNGEEHQVADVLFSVDTDSTITEPDGSHIQILPETEDLPQSRGYGTIYALNEAMSIDPTLLNMVEDFSSLDITQMNITDLWDTAKDILFQWAGVENITSDSRGSRFDGQQLAFLEHFFGDSYNSGGNPIISREITFLNLSWNSVSSHLITRLLVQGPMAEIFPDATYDPHYDEIVVGTDLDSIIANTQNIEGNYTYWFMVGKIIHDYSYTINATDEKITHAVASLMSEKTGTGIKSFGEIMVGDEFNNILFGRSNNDILVGNEGDDSLRGFEGHDYLIGGEGNDFLYGNEGNDTLIGDQGNDYLWGEEGNDQLIGNEGRDYLRGAEGHDYLIGGEGNDFLYGNEGNDTLIGGEGNDILEGGSGDDIYSSAIGDGNDTIFDESGSSDSIAIDAADLYITRGDGGEADRDLYIRYGNGDIITIEDHFYNPDKAIEAVNGIDLTSGLLINGLPDVSEVLAGTDFNDTFYGSNGNDALRGYDGDDLYIFNVGDGNNDSISDSGGNDTIIINADELYFTGGSNLRIRYGDGDKITIASQFFGSAIESINGIDVRNGLPVIGLPGFGELLIGSWSNVVGDDTIIGNDTINGGDGNDSLYGNSGDDLYIFDVGDGVDIINDYAGNDSITVEGDFYLTRGYGGTADRDLYVRYGDGDVITVEDYFYNPNYTIENINGIDLTGGLPIAGQPGLNETLAGSDFNDTITGNDGNDFLVGNLGDDIYVFNIGDGADTISDHYDEINVLQLGAGIIESDLIITVEEDGSVTIGFQDNGTDSIHIEGDIRIGGNQLQIIRFNDGSELNLSEIDPDEGILLEGTIGNDTLTGTERNDTLIGYAGNDSLVGGSGDDSLDGGDGNDTLRGESGSDLLYGGAGNDILYGYDGDDTLIGGSGDDITNAGAGNDTYLYNIGDGADTINDNYQEVNLLQFGAGITQDNITLEIETDGSLTVQLNGSPNDSVHIEGSLSTGQSEIAFIRFDDGSEIDVSEIESNISIVIEGTASNDTLIGTVGNDTIYGYAGDDILDGGAGNDWIYGYDGNDTITGGEGNDTLRGYGDNDTYLYNIGDGDDWITYENGDDFNVLELGPGITQSDVRLHIESGGLFINFDNSPNDSIYIQDSFSTGEIPMDVIRFDDGSEIDLNGGLVLEGTDGFNSLDGTIHNDTIYGYGGTDFIRGYAGDDIIYGGDGGDRFSFYADRDGNDTIMDFVSGIDQMWLSNSSFNNAAEAVAAFSNEVLDLGNGNSITLVGVTSLVESDFVIF